MIELRGSSTKDNKAIVREACGPLLEILEDETVSVIHHSLTEFLYGHKDSPISTERKGKEILNCQRLAIMNIPLVSPTRPMGFRSYIMIVHKKHLESSV